MGAAVISAGSSVLVKSLKKHGIVLEQLTDGTFKVQIGALSVRISGDELTESYPKKPKFAEPVSNAHIGITSDAVGQGAKLQSIDLHGATVEDGIKLLEQHISRAIMAGLHEVEIIHGIGTGKLSSAIHQHLKMLPAVKRFELRPYNRGTTRVFL